MNCRAPVLFLVVSASVAAQAQQPTQEDLDAFHRIFAAHTIAVDGSKAPEQIPYAIVMESAFDRLALEQERGEQAFRDQLRARFAGTDADVESIRQVALGNAEFVARVHNDESRSVDAACARLIAAQPETLDAQRVAAEFETIKSDRLKAMQAHYQQALDGLSASVRTQLLSYADTYVRSGMTWGTTDNIRVAIEAPGAYLRAKALSCQVWLERPDSARTWQRRERMLGIDIGAIPGGENGRGPTPNN